MRLLVCGSRTWDDPRLPVFISKWLNKANTIIHGAALGADSMAGEYAIAYHVPVESYPADWEKHGKAAGPIRNQQMLDEGKPDLVIAFVDKPLAESRGTNDMVTRAKNAGLPVYVVEKL